MTRESFDSWGARIGHRDLMIGYVPGRKNVQLYFFRRHEGGGASIKTLAYFRTEEGAEQFADFIDEVIEGMRNG